ncbi:MAG: lysine--tRNA ligase [Patescibacteria group bacterium]|jgi:lysyl-tRNA synthetase class 2
MAEPHDELTVRRERLEHIIASGLDPYPSTSSRTHAIDAVKQDFDALLAGKEVVTIAGRVLAIREHGGSTFLSLNDGTGDLQGYMKQDVVGDTSYLLLQDLDVGDFIEITGTLFITKRGEKSILASVGHRMLAKSLRPLPEKWHGLADTELRLRKRYLDLIVNEEMRDRMYKRSAVILAMRNFMNSNGFLEVETPTLQPIYGGGLARPFKTYHNTLKREFYLRISDEMYLKRLLVGGVEKVYEITKVFRNEGIDRDHNPEFTMFESQTAYKNYEWGMDFFEAIFEHVATSVFGKTIIEYQGVELNYKRPWKRVRFIDAVQEVTGLDVSKCSTPKIAKDEVKKLLPKELAEKLTPLETVGEILALAFEELVESTFIQPTIVYDYPVEVSPLAKKTPDKKFVERFEAFIMGSEVGNNYSELNDPVDLEKRFIDEKRKEKAGFTEAHQTDYEYLETIQHGMPPACGLGIGVDRMIMFMTNAKNIKEVILFPTLRPKEDE